MKILLADDEPEILNIYRDLLVGCEHRVVTALDGREALELFAAQDFDLVVMDLYMPNMNGFDSIAEMQKQRPVPVIVITGYYPDNVVAARVEEMGLEVKAVLRKPVTVTELWNAIIRVQTGG